MKNLLKIFVLIAVLFAAVTETADAQTRRGRTSTNTSGSSSNEKFSGKVLSPGQVIDYYIDFVHDDESLYDADENCIGVSISTNEVSKEEYAGPWNYPLTTWARGIAGPKQGDNGIGSNEMKRYWADRSIKVDGCPADLPKTDEVRLELHKVGNGNAVQGTLFKGNYPMPVKIFGVIAKHHGHVLYGSYGDGGSIAISLFKMHCDNTY